MRARSPPWRTDIVADFRLFRSPSLVRSGEKPASFRSRECGNEGAESFVRCCIG
jgi:hypothetical protein